MASAIGRKWARGGAILGVVFALAGLGFALAAPGWIRRRAVSEAAARGIDLTVEDVSLGVGHVELRGVKARAQGVPQASAEIRRLQVSLRGLSPTALSAKDVDLVIDGPHESTRQAFERWMARHAQGAERPPLHLTGVHATWTRAFGEGTRVDAVGIEADVTRAPAGEELHGVAPSVAVHLGPTKLGPWRVELDRTAAGTGVRVVFDPERPKDGPALLLRGDEDAIHEVSLTVPRTRVARLGLPAVLGEPAQLEGTLTYRDEAAGRVTAECDLRLIEARMPSAPLPIDARVTARAGSGGGHDVTGEMIVGPLKSALSGDMQRDTSGVVVRLRWQAGPVPCASFLGPTAGTTPRAGSVRDIADQLGKLVVGLGLDPGQLRVRAEVQLDTRAFEQSRFSFVPEGNCK